MKFAFALILFIAAVSVHSAYGKPLGNAAAPCDDAPDVSDVSDVSDASCESVAEPAPCAPPAKPSKPC